MRSEDGELWQRAAHVYAASMDAHKQVERFFEANDLVKKNVAYTVKGRVKHIKDIVSKVNRKRKGADPGSPEYDYEPHHITDGAGFRIITLFQDDILDVIHFMVDAIKQKVPSPFISNTVREAVIYTNRPPEDIDCIHGKVKLLLDASGLTFSVGKDGKPYATQVEAPKNKKSGYSSVHIVLTVSVRDPDTGQAHLHPVEVQVRDIFEEAWGEIDHRLRYMVDREGLAAPSEDLISLWKPHLNALKTFADGCSQHATLIKRNAIDELAQAETRPEKKTFDEGGLLAAASAQLPKNLCDELAKGIAAREEYLERRNVIADGEEQNLAADIFREVRRSAAEYYRKPAGKFRNVEYVLDMEYAFCLRESVAEEAEEAVRIYRRVLTEHPGDAVALYRLARIVRDRGEHEYALDLLRKSASSLESDPTLSADSGLRIAVPRNIGYTCWLMAEREVEAGRPERAAELFAEAISATEHGLRTSRASLVLADDQMIEENNILYYKLRQSQVLPHGDPVPSDQALVEAAISLEGLADRQKQKDVLTYHTVLSVYRHTSDTSRAEAVAGKIGAILFDVARRRAGDPTLGINGIKRYLSPSVHDIVDDVAAVLFAVKPVASGGLEAEIRERDDSSIALERYSLVRESV